MPYDFLLLCPPFCSSFFLFAAFFLSLTAVKTINENKTEKKKTNPFVKRLQCTLGLARLSFRMSETAKGLGQVLLEL